MPITGHAKGKKVGKEKEKIQNTHFAFSSVWILILEQKSYNNVQLNIRNEKNYISPITKRESPINDIPTAHSYFLSGQSLKDCYCIAI